MGSFIEPNFASIEPSDSVKSITQLSQEVVDLFENESLKEVTSQALSDGKKDIEKVERCIYKLVEKRWPRRTLERFFHSYRDTHLTMTSVSAMMCRVLELSSKVDDITIADMYRRSVLGSSEVMADDLGLSKESHTDLYYRMANNICGSETWELKSNAVESTTSFRKWVYFQRSSAPDIIDGLTCSLSSEIYNHGELTFMNQIFPEWIENVLGFSREDAKYINFYVEVHAGGLEVDHFMSAFNAVYYYCKAQGQEVDYSRLGKSMSTYLENVGNAFAGIEKEIF